MPTYRRLIIAWFFVPVHRLLFRLSGGRLLGRLEGEGILILVTRGRRSGRPRLSPLMYFQFEESGDLVVVASNYGQDRHPAWYLNVAADPNVSVEANGERFAAEARITQAKNAPRCSTKSLRRIHASLPTAPVPTAGSPSSRSAALDSRHQKGIARPSPRSCAMR